ncbi:phosphate acetyltransferase [Terasakiella sp. A23]|uniref:phosphate acetyltransferase n=1 Tax=Terasakiella sp. FCG-A23 TaxID=3080561 RepID=UPI002954BDFE|nr:phosphate acetyltransferase [Terasakiella sp. A23]MDV7341785.1 phosphate acetyltransferase [Terasakiella sp. A23]
MKPFDDLVERAQATPKHIVMAEGEDPRVIEGALRALDTGIAHITLLGSKDKILPQLTQNWIEDERLQVVDPTASKFTPGFVQELVKLRKHKGMTEEKARVEVAKTQNFANLMVRLGFADGSVAGAQLTTADVVRSAIQIIGVDKRYSMISSFFIMMLCEPFHDMKGALVFADCGLVVDPNEEELTQIGIAAADSAASLLALDPRIAMLSFSTKGSASHPHVDKVNHAADRIKALRPDLHVDGDLQLDASIVPSVSESKAPDSDVAGHANVLIFPDLEAGNIGYKMAERIGKAKAIGPVLQGLARPANDLSRGCDADAVFRMIAVTVVQAQA